MKNNCLPWSLKRWYKQGGYLVIRRTRLGKIKWWPHFLWLPPNCPKTGKPCDQLESFSPIEKKVRWFPPIIFEGYIKKGDSEDEHFRGLHKKRRRIMFKLSNIDWADIGSTLFGIYYFAQKYVYPGLTPEQVIGSIQDLTIFGHLVDVGFAYFMLRLKSPTTKIQYITPEK